MNRWQGGGDRRPRRPLGAPSAPLPEEPRPERGPRLVLGLNPVREVIRVHGVEVGEVWVEADPNPRLQALSRFATDHQIHVRTVARATLERLAGAGKHQGVAAFAPELRFHGPEGIFARPDLLGVALDGIVDPQNFGAVIRSAVGLAGAPILWAENASAPLTPTTFRASAGAVEHATLCRVRSLPGTLELARAQGITVVGLAPDGARALDELDLSGPTLLVIGSEEDGLGRATRRSCTEICKLRSTSIVQSLNASVASALALYTAIISRKANS